jgi:hypothetical protein
VVNLVTNAIEAMASVADWSRELIIRSERHEDDHDLDPPFNAFLTTKLGGMGIGVVDPLDHRGPWR